MGVGLTEVLGGAVGGSAIQALATFASGHGERSRVRADVVRLVGNVEAARWAPRSWDEFRSAVAELRAGCLIAGIERVRVEQYIFLAAVACRASHDEWDQTDGASGSIAGPLADLTYDAGEGVVQVAWRRWRRFRRDTIQLTRLNARRAEVAAELMADERQINWEVRI